MVHEANAPQGRVTGLRASNYRSLGDDVEVSFGSLTALVGPNGAGKSNVLDALRFLREALTIGLEPAISKRLGIARLRRDAPTRPRSVKVAADLTAPDGSDYSYSVQIDPATGGGYRIAHEELSRRHNRVFEPVLRVRRGRVDTAPEGLAPEGSATDLVLPSIGSHHLVRQPLNILRGVRVHSIFPRELGAPQAVGTRPPLDDTGSNWCAALRALPPAAHADLNRALARVTGDIVNTRVEPTGGFYVAEFAHRMGGTEKWFNAAQESDGTLRLAGILTALVQEPAPGFIGIEEPELTINPGLLPLVYDYLSAASERSQVVITTHSPELLDLLDIEDVRVVQRVNAATQITAVSAAQRRIVRESLATAGELLRAGSLTVPDQETDLLSLLEEG